MFEVYLWKFKFTNYFILCKIILNIFVKKFLTMPPNSAYLNPLDYDVWIMMQEEVYHTPIHDVNDLKQLLLDVWATVDRRIIYRISSM